MRTSFLIDGFNLYHSLRDACRLGQMATSARWLDLKSLCAGTLPSLGRTATLGEVHYFSAIATHLDPINPDYTARHRRYIQCLEDSGVLVHLGNYKTKPKYCGSCGGTSQYHEEKETDVSIALHVLDLLYAKSCDRIVIVSGDTDLALAVRMANARFAGVPVIFAFPWRRKNRELAQLAPGSFKLRPHMYLANQFPDPYVASDGTSHSKPLSW